MCLYASDAEQNREISSKILSKIGKKKFLERKLGGKSKIGSSLLIILSDMEFVDV